MNPVRLLAARPTFLTAAVILNMAAGIAVRASDTSLQTARPSTPQLQTEVLSLLAQGLAGTTNVQASFKQRKHLALLEREIVIQGHLAVQAPDRLAWHVTAPIRFSIVLTGPVLQQWDEETKKVQRISLDGNPVFGVVARLLRGGLSGDVKSLAEDFDARILASTPPQVEFIPKGTSLAAKVVRRIVLTVREDQRYVQAILIEQLDGDRTDISFSDTRLNSPIAPAAWEVEPAAR